jgi:ABC-type transporter Mla subunit MlaD
MAGNSDAGNEEIANNVNETVTAVKTAAADFAQAAAEGKVAVEAAGRAADRFGDLADEVRDYFIASASKSVKANPLVALAAAAGAGFLFAQWSRGGRR